MSQVYVHSIVFRSAADPDPAHLRDAVAAVTTAATCDDYVIQGERGQSGNYHLQGYFKTADKIRPRTLQKRIRRPPWCDSVGVRPCSGPGRAALKTYAMKEDTRVLPPIGLRPIYMARDLACMANPLKWQSQLLEMISRPPDDRTIVWIFNDRGNAGKSKLMKYCHYKKLATRVPLGTATQIKSAVIMKGPHRCYMVDLPRVRGSQERQAELFSALESLKSGWVETCMYGKPAAMLCEPPHVIIFSNELPDLRLASADRWRIYHLRDAHSLLEPSEPE